MAVESFESVRSDFMNKNHSNSEILFIIFLAPYAQVHFVYDQRQDRSTAELHYYNVWTVENNILNIVP